MADNAVNIYELKDASNKVKEIELAQQYIKDVLVSISSLAIDADIINAVYNNLADINTVAGITVEIQNVSAIDGDVTIVANIAGDVTTVASIAGNVTIVAGLATEVEAVGVDLAKGIGTNQPTDSAILNALTNATQTIADVVLTNADVVSSGINATNAELFEWEAEAERLTADSYATEAHGDAVQIYTSDGDGSFTPADTSPVEYSALHWSTEASTFNPALYALLTGATFTGQVKGIAPVSAEDLARKDYVDDGRTLLAEIEVSGSAVSSVEFTGLDLESHKSYRIEVDWIEGSGSNQSLSMFINNLTTTALYYSQNLSASSTTVSASRGNNGVVGFITGTTKAKYNILVQDHTHPRANSIGSEHYTLLSLKQYSWVKASSVTNVTSIQLQSGANSIGVGSKFRLYRGDM